VEYDQPAIADYGNIVQLTAELSDGYQTDAYFPCGRPDDPSLS
jgi:hypothetical protein